MAYYRLTPDCNEWRVRAPINHYVSTEHEDLKYEILRLELAYNEEILVVEITEEEFTKNCKRYTKFGKIPRRKKKTVKV